MITPLTSVILFMAPGKELRGTDFAAWGISVSLRYRCSQSLPYSDKLTERKDWAVFVFECWNIPWKKERETSSTTDFSWQALSRPPTKFLASAMRNWLAGFAHTSFPRHLWLACCWLAVVNLLSLTRVIQKSQNSLAINSMNLVGHIWRISQM